MLEHLLPNVAPTASSLPTWAEILFGGVGATLIGYLGKWVSKRRAEYRAVRTAPVLKDAADIAQLQADVHLLKEGYEKIWGWLGGTKDILGRDKHDGFMETFPAYQDEVRGTLQTILDKIENGNRNGHSV